MLIVDLKTKQINITRGDFGVLDVELDDECVFKIDDVVRFKVFEANKCENVKLQKDIVVEQETPSVTIKLTKEDTKIGDIINKPTDYWYEVELNPDTKPQTIIGYDIKGAKIFRLYPEGGDTQ